MIAERYFTVELFNVSSERTTELIEELAAADIDTSGITSLGSIIDIRVPSDMSKVVSEWIARHSDEIGMVE